MKTVFFFCFNKLNNYPVFSIIITTALPLSRSYVETKMCHKNNMLCNAGLLTNPHRQPRGPSPCARVEESSSKWFVTNKASCTPHTVNNNTTTDKYLGIYTDLVIPLHFLLKTADQIVGCHHKSRVIFSRQKWPLRTTLVLFFL